MKHCLFLLFLAFFALCGCTATRYTEVNGERFAMISEKEEEELADQARLIVKRIKSRLSPAEKRLIETRKPEMIFVYSADRAGRATVRWVLPEREVNVVFEGEFLSSRMVSTLYARDKVPAVLDFSHPPSGRRKADTETPSRNNNIRRKF